MKSYIDIFKNSISAEFLKKHTVALMERELPQTTPAQHRAADYIFDLIKENGLEAERYNFVSDGKNVCYDAALPMAWDVSYATLSVVSEWDGERVIADYQKEPFAIVRYSVPTPPEGVTTRVVPWDRMMGGEDVEGAFVLVPYGVFVGAKTLVPILDRGATGFIGGTVSSHEEKPDSTHWINGATETNSWCVNADERNFIGFSVTPRIHGKLTEACKKGDVIVKAQTDAHRYADTMPAVTAFLPGESERELWVIAHTAEPLEDDNNAGVIGVIHSLIAIKKAVDEGKLPKPKYSIRLMLSPEAYGLCAFGKYFGEVLYDRCIGAVNVDGIPTAFDSELIRLQYAPSPVPFFGNMVMEGIWRTYASISDKSPYIDEWWGDHWDDDCFLSDITVGLPTIMPETVFYSWHNSTQRYGYIDYNKFARSLWIYTATIAAIAVSEKDVLEKFLPTAVEYAKVRLNDIANTCPPREGTNATDRFNFWKNIEIANVRAFGGEDVNREVIDSVCDKIEEYAKKLKLVQAEKKATETPVFDSLEDIVIERNCIGVPRDLMRIPLERRWHSFDKTFMNRVFCLCDGKKTLKTVVTEAEWENKRAKTEEQLSDFLKALELLAEFEYIKLERK
ncbi:MAG: hypothetical protein IJC09_05325 [Clostridia bacterium]|nr:hypothetical protein [Clostridia bacterium]